jgi:hypothetical protein
MTAIAYGGCGINSLRAGYYGLNGGGGPFWAVHGAHPWDTWGTLRQ